MKTGLDYFPFDVTMAERFELIEAQFGHKGFVVMVRLWMKIYGGSGYYCEWSGDAALLFSKKIGIPVQDVADIVSAAVKRGLFDRTLFQQAGILTSREIQTCFFEATVRRKCVEVRGEYLLLERGRLPKNVYVKDENVDIFEQSKVKESKVKESKVKESKREEKREENAAPAAAAVSTPPGFSSFSFDFLEEDDPDEAIGPEEAQAEEAPEEAQPEENPALLRYSPKLRKTIGEWLAYKEGRGEAYSPLSLEKFLHFEVDRALTASGEDAVCGLIGLCIAKQWKNLHWEELSAPGERPRFGRAEAEFPAAGGGANDGIGGKKSFNTADLERILHHF